MDVTLERMARIEKADHVQMFEYFAKIKQIVVDTGTESRDGAKLVDDCISLWTHML